MTSQICVVGANSQLGQTLKLLRPDWRHVSQADLNLLQTDLIAPYFREKPKMIINFSAFTAVDLAEQKRDEAYRINALAVRELAKSCEHFIHISTDYVFSGDGQRPYREDDPTGPINHYGSTKLTGEILALEVQPQTSIFRTSWLYSEFNMNFVKRMIELGRTRDSLKVVNDQRGCPTWAQDLVEVVILASEKIFKSQFKPGVYHYSNEGECSWYELTKEIFRLKGIQTPVTPISSAEYPTPARRPRYSVFDKTKIKTALNIEVPPWQVSLEKFLTTHKA